MEERETFALGATPSKQKKPHKVSEKSEEMRSQSLVIKNPPKVQESHRQSSFAENEQTSDLPNNLETTTQQKMKPISTLLSSPKMTKVNILLIISPLFIYLFKIIYLFYFISF